MMKLCALALFATLHTAAATAGDCTVADFTEADRAMAAEEDPALSDACTCPHPHLYRTRVHPPPPAWPPWPQYFATPAALWLSATYM
jgi:hypothetical protein